MLHVPSLSVHLDEACLPGSNIVWELDLKLYEAGKTCLPKADVTRLGLPSSGALRKHTIENSILLFRIVCKKVGLK